MDSAKLTKSVGWFMQFDFYKRYLLPGFIAQSVVIAGGYGTGRELIEYFLKYGPRGGLMGMLLVTVVLWAVVYAISFEFARLFKTYDYRAFFHQLVGKGWILYEICYFVLLLLVLAVVGASAGSILDDQFGVPFLVGAAIFLLLIAALTYSGSEVIGVVLSWWSYVLYIVYIAFFITALTKFGDAIAAGFDTGEAKAGWAKGGFNYAFYNLGVFPAVLFALRYIETRKQAVIAGLLASLICIIPGLLFYLVTVGFYPAILDQEVPAYYVLVNLGGFLLIAYLIVFFGTMIETGAGMIHAVNERINGYFTERTSREIPRWLRGVTGLGLAMVGIGISNFGLVALIARGYGTISWGFFVLHGVAVVTIGAVKIVKYGNSRLRAQESAAGGR